MESLKLLIIEDNEDDLLLILRALRRGGYEPAYEHVQTADEMRAALAGREWDVIISDHKLPHFSSSAALALAQEDRRDIPFIVVSGTIGEEAAVSLMKSGAHDYVMKGNLTRLPEVIRREIREARVRAERRQAEEALRASERNLARAQQMGRLGNWEWDVANNALIWSDEIYRIFGIGKDFALTFESIETMVHPDDRAHNQQMVQKMLADREPVEYDLRIICPDGEVRHIHQTVEASADADDRIVRLFGIMQDITARKHADEALRASEEKYRVLIENAGEGIYVAQEGVVKFANSRAAEITGYSIAELVSKPLAELVHPEDRARMLERHAARLAGGEFPPSDAYRIVHRSGETRWIELSATPIQWAEKRATLNFASDITERKRAEEALREREEQYKLLFENANEVILVVQGGRIVLANPEAAAITEYSQDELVSRPFVEFIHPEDRAMVAANYASRLRADPIPSRYSFRIVRKDGATRWVEINAVRISWLGAPATLNFLSDITERRQAEEALHESEERYRLLFESANDAIYMHEVSHEGPGRFLAVNDQACRLLGYSREEFLRMSIADIDVPEQQERIPAIIEQLLTTGQAIFETEHLAKDGRRIPAEISTRLFETGGRPVILSIARDISERKQAEEALQRLSARHEAMLAEIPDIIMEVDANKTYTWANPAGYEFFGADVIGKEASSYFLGEQDTYARIQPLFDGNMNTFYAESWQRRKDGQRRLLAWWCRAILDSQGRVTGALSSARDITEQNRAEEALRENRANLSALIENSNDRVWTVDRQYRLIIGNTPLLQSLAAAHGRQVQPGESVFSEQVPAEIRAEWRSYYDRALRGESFGVETLSRYTPTPRYMEYSFSPIYDGGEISGVVISGRDITERKRAAEMIWRQNQYLAALQETTLDLASQLDLDRLLENIVRRAGQLFDAPSGGINMHDPQTEKLPLTIATGRMARVEEDGARPGEGVAGVVWQTRQPLIVADYDAWPQRMSGYPDGLLSSVMGAPLLSGEQVIGVLGLAYDKEDSRVFGEEDVAVLAQFARFAAIAIENARLYTTAQQELAERKAAQEALAHEQYLMNMLMDHLPHNIYFKDLQSRYLRINRAKARSHGFADPAEAIGKSDADLFSAEHARQALADEQRIIQTGEPIIDLEEKDVWLDGRESWTLTTKAPLRDPQGQIIGTFGISRDITERKQAEERIRRSEADLRRAQQIAHMGSWAWDVSANRLEGSDETYRIVGIAEGDFTGGFADMLAQIIHPDDRAAVSQAFIDYIGGKGRASLEFRITRPDGATRAVWVETGEMVLDEAGNPQRLSGIIQDITERKQAEEALRQRSEELATVLDALPVLVWIGLDPECRVITGNRAANELTGSAPETNVSQSAVASGQAVYLRQLKEDGSEYRADELPMQRAIALGQPVRDALLDFRLADGRRALTLGNAAPLFDSQGQVRGAVAAFVDITERRRAEQVRLEHEEELAAIYENAPAIMMLMDGEGRVQRVNGLAARFSGRAAEEAVGLCCGDVLHCAHAQDVPEGCGYGPACQRCAIRLTALETIESGEGHYQMEGRLRSMANGADKEMAYLLSTTRLQVRERPVALVSIVDITASKQMEAALHESQARYEMTVNAINEGIWDWNIVTGATYFSPTYYAMLGYEPGAFPGEHASFLSLLHPDDRPKVEGEIARCVEADKGYALEFRLRAKSGKYRWVLSRGSVVERDAAGRPLRMAGAHSDITERKEMEAQVRLNEARMRSLYEISQYQAESPQGFLDYALEEAIRLTNSKLGYIYYYDEDKKLFTLNTWSKHVMEECTVADPQRTYSLEKTGIWGEAVRQRRPILFNDFQSPHPLKRGYPPGHAALRRYLTIPVMVGERIVATVAVANKEAEYDDSDQLQLTLLMDAVWKIAERRQMEEQLRRSEERYRAVSEAADAGISIVDAEEIITYANPALARMFGYPLDELIGMNLSQLVDASEFVRYQALTAERKSGVTGRYETKIRRKDGKSVDLLVSASPLRSADGRYESALAVLVDITERKQLEEQLQQSHKLESVGLLAGGVAHDLNNMLVPILGYAEMLRDDMPPTDARRADAQEIVRAGGRARDLVRQLLAFARKQILEMKLLDLNQVVGDLYKMLRRTVREDIAIETVLAPGLGMIKGDVGQIEQVLMNLSVNAQDAMPQGGVLHIETSAATLDGSREGVAAGDYIQMTISDTGVGMDQETLSRLFEPFFTTKGVGKGTGLGLATVYGIIKQHSGHIEVESRAGHGTIFRVYWPQAAPSAASAASSAPDAGSARGAETILVVEDQDEVRAMTCRILQRQGYEVLAASSGAEALELAAAHSGPIHLLLSDIVMPGMDGRALYEKLAAARPEMKAIYMSGYSEDVIGRHGVLEPGTAFVQKPFAMQTLTAKVREVLDQTAPNGTRRTKSGE